MEAAVKAPLPRQPRRNFAAWAIFLVSLLATCTVWLSASARIAEQSLIRFGLPIGTLKVSGSFVRQVLSNPQHAALVTGLSPLFSPRGEAKRVRGPSVRGARRLTSAGVLDSTLSTASKRNEGMAGLSCASVVRWSEMRVRTLGQTLGLKVVCEGIETVEQSRCIERTRQCDEVRGLVVSKPVEAGRFQQLLIAGRETPVLRRIGSRVTKSETQGITLMEDWSKLGGIA